MLNKSCRHAGESPLIILNINIALSFFLRVERLSQLSLFRRIISGTSVVTAPGNDPGSPILEFLEFVAQGNAEFIPNRAAIVKVGQNQRLVDLKSGTFGDEWSYAFKGAYGWGYLLTNFVYMFCPWKVFVNKQAQRFSFFDFFDRFSRRSQYRSDYSIEHVFVDFTQLPWIHAQV